MTIKNKIAIAVASLALSQVVFALQDTSVKMLFVNNTDRAGTVEVQKGRLGHIGPDVEGNGGHASWIFNAKDYEQQVTIGLINNGWNSPCFKQDKRSLGSLNILAYKGDTLTITFTGSGPEGELYCTCQGSACW